MMGRAVRGFAAITVLAITAPGLILGQEDFRNTDRGRPLFTEDAYPIELREWEFELGADGRLVEGETGRGANATVGLKTGAFPNTEIGLEVEAAVEQHVTGTEFGFGGIGARLVYGLSRETWSWPAFAIRAAAHSAGSESLGRDGWTFELSGLATRSFDRLRLHVNAGHQFSRQERERDSWRAGLAVDYPIGLFGRLVMADVYAEIPVEHGRTRLWLELGTRWQASNASVIDFGLGIRLDEWASGRSNLELTVGFSRAFGIPGLVGVPPHREPRLD